MVLRAEILPLWVALLAAGCVPESSGSGATQDDLDAIQVQLSEILTRLDGLEADVAALQDGETGTTDELAALAATVDALDAQIAPLLAYVQVDEARDEVIFEGANVLIRSGAGATDADVNGLGNLIIGYNESDTFTASEWGADNASAYEQWEDPLEPPGTSVEDSARRTGSHNLIIGRSHQYLGHSSIAVGYNHRLGADAAAVLGGEGNTITGEGGASLGSVNSQVRSRGSAAVGAWQSVVGNTTLPNGQTSVVLGGVNAKAADSWSVTIGGSRTQASGSCVRLGGDNQSCSTQYGVYP